MILPFQQGWGGLSAPSRTQRLQEEGRAIAGGFREREIYHRPQPRALRVAQAAPALFICYLVPPLQMLREHGGSSLGTSGVTENSLAGARGLGWQTGVSPRTGETSPGPCARPRRRSGTVRLGADEWFPPGTRSGADHTRPSPWPNPPCVLP